MTLQQFLEKWNGQFCEIAGSANAKNQCVDLANAYLRDVCKLPIIEWTNACDFPKKTNIEWIPNDEITDLPKEGDIIIWNSNVGSGAGHIAIFLDGTTSKFNSFDQNWPLYSPCHVQSHTYTNVSGWLRPIINSDIDMTLTDEQKRILDFIGTRTEGDVREAFGALGDMPKKNEQILTLTNKVHELELQVIEIEKALAEFKTNYIEKDKEVAKLQKAITTANANLNDQILKNEELDRLAKDNRNLYLQKNDEFNAYKLAEKANLKDEVIKEISITETFVLLIKKLIWTKSKKN